MFLIVFFISLITHANLSIDQYTREKIKAAEYIYTDSNKTPYKQCETKVENTSSFFVDCNQGEFKKNYNIERLWIENKKISKKILEKEFNENLKRFALHELKIGKDEILSIKKCLKHKCPDYKHITSEIKQKLKRLRVTMALKDIVPLRGEYDFGISQSFNKNIHHNIGVIFDKKIPPISRKEEKKVIDEINSYRLKLEKQWEEKNKEKRLSCHQKSCKALELKKARELFQAYSSGKTKFYTKRYNDLLTEMPLLLLLGNSETNFENDLLDALDKTINAFNENIHHLKSNKTIDSLFLNKNLMNKFLSSIKEIPFKCEMANALYQKAEDRQNLKDLGIGGALMSAGFFCNSTGRLPCSFITGLFGESISLAIIQDRLNDSVRNLQTGLIDAKSTMELSDERNLAIIAAPLLGLDLKNETKFLKQTANKFFPSPLKKQINKIQDSFNDQEKIDFKMSDKKIRELKIENNTIKSDLSFLKLKREGGIPLAPPPIEEIEGIPFVEYKVTVTKVTEQTYDRVLNATYSAESKKIEHLIPPLNSGSFSDEQMKLMTEKIIDFSEPPGGTTESYFVTLENGTKAIFKPNNRHWGTNPRAEIVASELNDFFEFNLVPTTVHREVNGRFGSLQVLEDSRTNLAKSPLAPIKIEESGKLHLFDFLIDSRDRHGGNSLVGHDNTIIAIDNSNSFTGRGQTYIKFKNRKRFIDAYLSTPEGRQMIERFKESQTEAFTDQLKERLGQEDTKRFMQRLSFLINYYENYFKNL